MCLTHSAHEVRLPRAPFKTFGPQIKWWIKWTRIVQLGLRVLELIAAAGILFLFIIISDVDALTAWVMRIVVGAPHTRHALSVSILTIYSRPV